MNVYLNWAIVDEDDIAIIDKAKDCIKNGIESFEYGEMVFFIHKSKGDYYLDSITKDELEAVTSPIEWDESEFSDYNDW